MGDIYIVFCRKYSMSQSTTISTSLSADRTIQTGSSLISEKSKVQYTRQNLVMINDKAPFLGNETLSV